MAKTWEEQKAADKARAERLEGALARANSQFRVAADLFGTGLAPNPAMKEFAGGFVTLTSALLSAVQESKED